jgi:transcriptional regulator with XRE-family HTH domain
MLSVVKTEQRLRARELRALGWSVKEIERHLGVARSSVSLWVRDIELTPDARCRLLERTGLGPIVAAQRKAAAARDIRRRQQLEGRVWARKRGDSYAAGCMLYWAEGDKCRNGVRMSNSDPELLAVFATFLREHFGVTDEQMSIYCNLFADHVERQREVEAFWLGRLGLPASALRKSMINNYSKHSQKKRKNKLPYGTCKLVVNSTLIVQTIYGSIQEYGGFDRPEWLD